MRPAVESITGSGIQDVIIIGKRLESVPRQWNWLVAALTFQHVNRHNGSRLIGEIMPSICTDAKAKQLLNLCSNEDAIINEVAKLNKGDQYELNKTLIDMRMIPTHIVTKIIECYNTSSTFT